MTNYLFAFRRFLKSKYLRIVNLLGLSIIFACLVLSYIHVKKELSYDRFNVNAGRMARLSLQNNDDLADGRIYGFTGSGLLTQFSEIEQIVALTKVNTVVLTYKGKPHVINDIYYASSNFFDVFSYPLLQGQKENVLNSPDKVVISESFARRLFGKESPMGKEIQLEGRKIITANVFVSGVFKDFPENSHFHTDILVHRPDTEDNDWPYIYLLVNRNTDLSRLEQKISDLYNKDTANKKLRTTAHLIPLTDIHLHSRVLREMEPNGNIYFVYLIIGSNILLLVIVLFNLWLNAGLIFSYNRKYYQLLRLNGASSTSVLHDEAILALILGILSIILGGLFAHYGASVLHYSLSALSFGEKLFLCAGFLVLIIIVSLLPVLVSLSSILFLNTGNEINPRRFSFSNVKYMLVGQYAIVMFVVILAVGISKQVTYIKNTQVGGNDSAILVMQEQPDQVKLRYKVLKTELQKHSEIKNVTAAMQLPGSAIRDMLGVKQEGENEFINIPLLVVGEDFLPFFNVKPVDGETFSPDRMTSDEEKQLFMKMNAQGEKYSSSLSEEYILNNKAVTLLGMGSPDNAIGKLLTINHGSLGYINQGKICGVVNNFTYTTMYEDTIPMIIIQRPLHFFLNCIMVRLDPENVGQSLQVFNKVWAEVNPDYPPNYSFLQDEYGKVYRNELNAEMLVRIFSILCLIIANLGLIVFMAFIIKSRTKEIGIRRVNGAKSMEIVRMLNLNFIRWIALAFVIAVPLVYFIMQRWLADFAHKTSLDWWIFVLAGLFVLLLSVLSVSWMTWRAATVNPVDAIKGE
ncbi:MAG: ABC transporter permease [Rikenellaceae bacterium]